MTKKPGGDVHGGKYYGVTAAGRMIEIGDVDRAPDAVICRRVVDFPGALVPAGGAVAACTTCGASVVYNPAGPHQNRPRRCMQCAGVRPLPLP